MTTSPGDARTPPVSRRGLPVVGELFDAWRDPLAMFVRARSDYGRIVEFRLAWMRYLLVASESGARRVLVENARGYEKSVNYEGLKFILGKGLLTSEGDFWRRQRKLTQPAFHRDRLAGFATTMVRATDETIDAWLRGTSSGTTVDAHAEMMSLTLRIVVRTLFGTDVPNAREIGDAVSTAIEWSNRYVESLLRIPPHVPTPRNREFRLAKGTLDALVQRIVEERRGNTTDREDLLSMYMEMRDEETGEGMSDEQLRDEVMTLVLAGHETTANALSWALWLLAKHPTVTRRLRQEIEGALGERAPTPADLRAMPYLSRTVDEVLRLYPPAWMVERQALEDDVVDGFHVEKGVVIGVSPYVIHRDPEYWPNPEGFDPDRFLPEVSASRPKHAYVPFGAGPRVCIGNSFALMEAQLVLARILQRTDFDLIAGQVIGMDPSVTLRPDGPVLLRITRRTMITC